ncbi:MAG: MFS transporter [Ilumatobacteraceae bacterium]|nr:MFS transporter [Ilumatobacteraceae bacterium]
MDLRRQAEGGGRLRRRQLNTEHTTGGIWSSRYLAVTVANLTVVAIAAFDGLAVASALPSIADDLGRIALLPWVLTGYLATSAIAVIVAGPVIDAIGVRRTFRITGTWFLGASALAALAPTMETLIAARVLQGLGGGLVIAVALAAVGLAYPHELRPKAFAANSIVWGVMGFGGPAIAGALLAIGDWRFVFAVKLPITAVAIAVGWRALPSTRERPTRITTDWIGIAWLAVVVAASLATVAQLGSDWGIVGISLAVTIAAAAGYWRHAGRADTPVLRREHLTRFPLGFVHLSTGAILIAGLAADNYLPIYVHTVRERSIEFAAFSLVFLTVGWTLGAIAFSRVPTTWPETRTTLAGSTLMIPSLILAWLSISGGWHLGVIFTAYALIGVSIGLVSTSGVTYMQRGAAEAEMGRVNSAHQFVRTLCITYAVAIGGAILLATVDARTGDIEAVRELLAGEETVTIDVPAGTVEAIADGVARAILVALGVSLAAWVVVSRSHRRALAATA